MKPQASLLVGYVPPVCALLAPSLWFQSLRLARSANPIGVLGWLLAASLLAAGCSRHDGPAYETSCRDGIDNDGDKLVDCADPDCRSSPICTPAQRPPRGLTRSGAGWQWSTGRTAAEWVVFELDNATAEPLVVRVDGEGRVPVAAGKREELYVQPGEVRLACLDGAGQVRDPDARFVALPGRRFLVNLLGAAAYTVTTQKYSAMQFQILGDPSARRELRLAGRVFLDVTEIDHRFAPLPEKIEVTVDRAKNPLADLTAAGVRRALQRAEATEPPRLLRLAAGGAGKPALWAALSGASACVSSARQAGLEPAELVVDNPHTAAARLLVAGAELTRLPAGGALRLQLPPGELTLEARVAGQPPDVLVVKLAPASRHAWSLHGRREWVLHYQHYTSQLGSMIPTLVPRGIDGRARGRRFFEVRADRLDEPLPAKGPAGARLTTLRRGRSGDFQRPLQAELERLRAAVRAVGAAQASELEEKLRGLPRPLSDCELLVAQRWAVALGAAAARAGRPDAAALCPPAK